MATFFTLLGLFFAGLALDWLVTLHYRFIASRRRVLATLSNFVVVASSLSALGYLVGPASTLAEVVAYSTGAALGCYLAVGNCRKTG